MKASTLLVKCLEKEGLRYIFGIPGEENADFILSLSESKAIEFILTRHEQGAAFMAEVYGRLTGKPAACLGTLGPGASNLITGVADANMDRAPLIVLTGQGGTYRLHKESHQMMDVVSMFRPVTKWATSVYHAGAIPEIVRKAFRIATNEKPGAVHIELPEDVAKFDTDDQPLEPHRLRRACADDKIVDRAYDLLAKAKNPVILAGNGAIRRRASKQLRIFCAATGIGALNTFMAKGAVDRDADYSMFTIGLGAKDLPSLVIDQADLIVALGFDMVEYPPRLWNPNGDKQIIHCDFLPAETDRNYNPEIELVGDLAHTMWMLNERQRVTPLPKYDLSFQRAMRASMEQEFSRHADDDTDGSIRPQKILWDTRRAMGARDILLSDVGAHKMWIARYYQCHEPNTCIIPNGFCSMGFALPGAIAAHLVYPERRILAITGDGGFLMNAQEMETAKRINANIVVMIWEDCSFGLIAWKQEMRFGRHTPLSFGNPDWLKLADSFGWSGRLATRSRDFAAVLDESFNEPGPSLIVVPVDYDENKKLTEHLGNITCQL